jgi:hypothetical protein
MEFSETEMWPELSRGCQANDDDDDEDDDNDDKYLARYKQKRTKKFRQKFATS